MDSTRAIPDLLWAFLYGRRRHRRYRVDMEGHLVGPRGPIPVQVADVSRGGVLLRMERKDLLLAGPEGGLVERNFGPSFLVELPRAVLSAEATIARIAWPPTDPKHLMIGCQFTDVLDEKVLERMGVPTEEVGYDAASGDATSCMLFGERDREELTVQIHEAGGDLRVPLIEGRLVSAGDETLVMFTDHGDIDSVSSRLAGRGLALVVLNGLDAFWAVKAKLLAVRPAHEKGVEVAILADSAPASLLMDKLEEREAV